MTIFNGWSRPASSILLVLFALAAQPVSAQEPVGSSLLPRDTLQVFEGGALLLNVGPRGFECERRDPVLFQRLTTDAPREGQWRPRVTCAARMRVPFEMPAPSAIQEGGMPEWRIKLLILAMAVVLALTLNN